MIRCAQRTHRCRMSSNSSGRRDRRMSSGTGGLTGFSEGTGTASIAGSAPEAGALPFLQDLEAIAKEALKRRAEQVEDRALRMQVRQLDAAHRLAGHVRKHQG